MPSDTNWDNYPKVLKSSGDILLIWFRGMLRSITAANMSTAGKFTARMFQRGLKLIMRSLRLSGKFKYCILRTRYANRLKHTKLFENYPRFIHYKISLYIKKNKINHSRIIARYRENPTTPSIPTGRKTASSLIFPDKLNGI